jgi:cytochrome c oxidase subunit 2
MISDAAPFYNDTMRRMLHLPPQASSVAFEIDQLHYVVIATTAIVSVAITAAAIYFFVKYKYRGRRQIGQPVHLGLGFEATIIIIPMIVFLGWFGLGFKQYVHITSTPSDAMEVYVMGKQWMWKFAYPDGPNSVGVLRVPVGRPVKLLMTSRDVIHSFFVPAFRLKKDVLPGRYTEMWFTATEPGSYEVFCAEYCGTGHSMMRAEVVAMKPEEFDQWMQQMKSVSPNVARAQDQIATLEEPQRVESNMIVQGERVAGEKGCLKCHSVDGSAHIGPTWLGLYHRQEKLVGDTEINVDEAYLTESMMDPGAKIVDGYSNVMPTFQGRLSAPEAAAIVEYIKSLHDPELQAQPSATPVFVEKQQ